MTITEAAQLTRICYERNFLANVIFRVDFSEILKINDSPTVFQEKVRAEFPLFNQQILREVNLHLAAGNAEEKTVKESKIWEFLTSDKNNKFSISSKHFVVEFKKYSSFEHLQTTATKLWSDLVSVYGTIAPVRVGLRYINVISLKDGDPIVWDGLINDSLISGVKGVHALRPAELRRHMSQAILQDDDSRMTFSYGVYNSEFPSVISRREFVLDYDCYTESPDANVNPLEKYLDAFHLKISDMFEKSIKDDLRNMMGRKP